MMPSDVLALDLGSRRSGFAFGAPGRRPESGVVLMRKPRETVDAALGNLMFFLSSRFGAGAPRLVAVERRMSLHAFHDNQTSEAAVYATLGVHAVAAAVCNRFGVPLHDVPADTARKHFVGRGRAGSRELSKAMVIERCRQLGWADDGDEDRCDALCVWDWACSELCRAEPKILTMFPPQPEPARRRRRRST